MKLKEEIRKRKGKTSETTDRKKKQSQEKESDAWKKAHDMAERWKETLKQKKDHTIISRCLACKNKKPTYQSQDQEQAWISGLQILEEHIKWGWY